MSALLAWPIVVPLAGAAVCELAPARVGRLVAPLTTAVNLVAAAALAWAVHDRGVLRHAVGGWGVPLGIQLRADGLAALLLLVSAVVGTLLIAPARAAPVDRSAGLLPTRGGRASWFFAWAAFHALLLSADVFNLYVALELTTLATVALIATRGDPDAYRAALRYLLVALPGSLVYLLGIAFLYAETSTLDLETLGARLTAGPQTAVAFALMMSGLSLKAALFPLHGWLPPAYVSASSSVAAFLSALVGKGAFYVLLRIFWHAAPSQHALVAGDLLGVLGAAAVLWGSLLALQQRRLVAIAAYSSIAQVGYLFLLFSIDTTNGWLGGAYLFITHAAASASMFLAAGTIERALGHDRAGEMSGVGHHLPVTFFALALAGISLMGMPPSGGFIAKWLLVLASIERGQWWWTAVVLAGGLLAAGYVFRVLRSAFLPARLDAPPPRAPRAAEIVALLLALVAFALGFVPAPALSLLRVGVRG